MRACLPKVLQPLRIRIAPNLPRIRLRLSVQPLLHSLSQIEPAEQPVVNSDDAAASVTEC